MFSVMEQSHIFLIITVFQTPIKLMTTKTHEQGNRHVQYGAQSFLPLFGAVTITLIIMLQLSDRFVFLYHLTLGLLLLKGEHGVFCDTDHSVT